MKSEVKGGILMELVNLFYKAHNEFLKRKNHPFFTYNGWQDRKPELVHRKQIDFHVDQSKSRWVFGGNRTGKTECGAMESIWFATATHPYRQIDRATSGWVVSLSLQVQRDVAQAKILKYLPTEWVTDIVMKSGTKQNPGSGIIDFVTVRNRLGTTSTIGFKSCDQGREKFQGAACDFIWFDEEPPEEIYDECLLRTLDTSGVIFGTMTPLKGRTWLYERIFLGGTGHSVHQMSWEDNPYLSQQEINLMQMNLSTEQLETRKHGRFSEASGLVFNELCEESIIDPIDLSKEDIRWIVSIDPGYVAPTACVFVACIAENFYVVDDYYQAGKQVDEHAVAIIKKCERLRIPKDSVWGTYIALIDSASSCRNLGSTSTVATQFRQYGIHVDTNINKNIMEGVMRIKALLKNAQGVRRLFIFKNCVHLIKELWTYYWGDSERPVKKNDHCIDALRYALSMDIFDASKYRKSKTVLEEKKIEMIKNHQANKF
ncbi:MAG: terminase family protein [Firmicutes bacterium]|nr:terminase family protein [Bacillota bacterium]